MEKGNWRVTANFFRKKSREKIEIPVPRWKSN